MSRTMQDEISFCVKVHEWPSETGLRDCGLTDDLRRTLENRIVQLFCEIMPHEVITVQGTIELTLGVLVVPGAVAKAQP